MKNRGFTIIELLIVVAVVAVVGVLVMSVAGAGCSMGSADHAEAAAQAHAGKLGWKVKGIACAGTDTDGDGYISCTVGLGNGDERNLECESGGSLSRASGCKQAPLIKQNVSGGNGVFEEPDSF